MSYRRHYKRKPKIDFFLCGIYVFMLYMILSSKIDIFKYGNKTLNAICGIVIPAVALVFMVLNGLGLTIRKSIKKKKYLNSTLAMVDTMSGEEFEEFLKVHFEKMGY